MPNAMYRPRLDPDPLLLVGAAYELGVDNVTEPGELGGGALNAVSSIGPMPNGSFAAGAGAAWGGICSGAPQVGHWTRLPANSGLARNDIPQEQVAMIDMSFTFLTPILSSEIALLK